MTIITKGMGAIIKHLGKKRKILGVKKGWKKPEKSWQDKRIDAMNIKIKKTRGSAAVEDYAQEASDIYKSKAPTKKVYKSIQKKFHALKPDQQSEIYMKKAKRDPKSFYFDKKKFGKK